MFAGAAREAVFSQPEVIRRINADFVPVALKAGLVNNPPDDEEGRLYREIGRSKIVPQGICVVNSAGKVLDWVLMFDDDKNVVAFLDHTLKRFAKFPDAKEPVPAERYMKFPSDKLEEVKDNGKALPVPDRHPEGKACPGKPLLQRGTVVARVFGRALDKDGKPVADTVRQEHYVEDRFQVTVAMQDALAKTRADAGAKRFRIADDLARLLASHAYLGQLDVNPVGGPGGKGDLKLVEIWAQKLDADGKGPVRLRVEGETEAVGASGDGDRGDGRLWQHEVKLSWEGLIEMQEGRVTRLLLVAHGSEKLTWGNQRKELKDQLDVARLPAGHPIDLACKVRYGMTGEPVPDEETGSAEKAGGAQGATQEIPDEARKQLIQTLGGPFIVFRDKVQEELKLSDDQKQKLLEKFPDHIQETMKIFEKIKDLKAEEREKEMQEHRKKSEEKLSAVLRDVLETKQQERLFQLQLQQAGTFALLGQNEALKKLKITEEQQKKFMAVVQEMQKKIEPLMKEAQSGGNPEEIRPKAMKIRKDHEGKIEAILSDAQKKQWKELLGKPFDFGEAPAKKRADEEARPPDEARRQLAQAFGLGPAFVVFRDKAQEELKLTDEQKKKLDERFEETAQEAMQLFQKLGELKPEEREKELGGYRQKAQDNLAAFLKGALKKEQLTRLRQLELQQEGPFALGQPDLAKELKFTDEQKKQFMAVMEEMQKQTEPLMKEAQSGGKPEEIAPKLMKIRKDHEGKLEALLTDAQKKQWKELLGKPFDFSD